MSVTSQQAATALACAKCARAGKRVAAAHSHDSDGDVSDAESAGVAGLLPRDVSPVHYALRLVPDYSDWTFAARVTITLRVSEETDLIQFNAHQLDIDSAVVRTASGEELLPTRINHSDEEQATTLRFDEPLRVGEATLTLNYRGKIGNEMVGLYRSQYVHNGTQHTILVTQFESCDARRCLPCWDEPARKATFDVTLVVPSDMQALSNMPPIGIRVLEEAEPNRPDTLGWVEHAFQTTPVMSSYLLALAVGRFESIQSSTKNGTLVRFLTPLGKVGEAEFALNLGTRALEFYEDFFGLPFPLPKMDMLAVPDIAITAMENWGLITFGETAALVHPTDGSLAGKQYAARIVAHEIAHQWFGNIVTMEWWTDLWLNEGFASWMEYFAVDALYPSWGMWSQYLVGRYNWSFAADAVANSHPVEVRIDNPDEISEVSGPQHTGRASGYFDSISYCKGSVLIRMLHAYLGAEPFRVGLSHYLHKYAYTNAVTKDLWATLSESSGRDVSEMMSQWCLQTGFPILQVRQIQYTPSGTVQLELTQRKFLLQGPQEKDATKWSLPVQLIAAGADTPTEPQLFNTESGKLEFALAPAAAAAASSSSGGEQRAFKLNASQTYLYRVAYPASHYPLLRESLFSFSAADRTGLQNDLFAAVRAGMLPFSVLGEFVETLTAREDDQCCWFDLTANLLDLGCTLKHSQEAYAKFCAWASSLYRPVLARVGWDAQPDEGHQMGMLRGSIIKGLTTWGDADTVRDACRRFHAFVIGEATHKAAAGTQAAALAASSSSAAAPSTSLAPDVREGVYFAVVAHGGVLGYETMLSRYHAQVAAGGAREEQVRCLNALAATPNKSLLSHTLEWALDHKDEVRTEDCCEFLCAAATNPVGTHAWWEFTKRRWADIVPTFEGAFGLPRVVSMAAQFSSDSMASEYAAFMKKHKAPSAERAVRQTVERMQSNAKWLARDEKNIAKFCSARLAAQSRA